MVYFSPHALFSQARSQLWFYKLVWFSVTSFAGLFMWIVMHSAWIVMLTLMLEGVHVLQQSFDAVLIGEVHDIIISLYTLNIAA